MKKTWNEPVVMDLDVNMTLSGPDGAAMEASVVASYSTNNKVVYDEVTKTFSSAHGNSGTNIVAEANAAMSAAKS